MTGFRYPQFCALARAAEVIGERWTLLILRELMSGPGRFSDLRRGLSGVSPSVLSERLGYLEELRIVQRSELGPPAPATVYELTETGRALGPALTELARWGARFLLPPRAGEHLEPEWMRVFLDWCAKSGPSPAMSCELRMPAGKGKQAVIHIEGGEKGTTITEESKQSHVIISGEPIDIAGVVMGYVDVEDAVESGRVRIEGDRSKVARLSELFEIESPAATSVSSQEQPQKQGETR